MLQRKKLPHMGISMATLDQSRARLQGSLENIPLKIAAEFGISSPCWTSDGDQGPTGVLVRLEKFTD